MLFSGFFIKTIICKTLQIEPSDKEVSCHIIIEAVINTTKAMKLQLIRDVDPIIISSFYWRNDLKATDELYYLYGQRYFYQVSPIVIASVDNEGNMFRIKSYHKTRHYPPLWITRDDPKLSLTTNLSMGGEIKNMFGMDPIRFWAW